MFSGSQFFVGCFGDVDFYNSNFFQITVMATEVFRALVTESRLARTARTPLRVKYSLDFPLEKSDGKPLPKPITVGFQM